MIRTTVNYMLFGVLNDEFVAERLDILPVVYRCHSDDALCWVSQWKNLENK